MTQRIYRTGNSPRALLHRFRMWRAYRRPVTFRDLRRITGEMRYRDGNPHQMDPAAEALFARVIEEAEKPVWRH